MTRLRWLLLAGLAGAACGAPPAPALSEGDAHPPAAATARAQTIRMEIPLAPDVADIPRLMVRDALQQAGYTIVSNEYRDPTTTTHALVIGELDVAEIAATQAFAAIQRGAPIVPISSRGGRTRVLVGVPEIKTCAELDNQQVSVPSLNSQAITLQQFVDTRCPGTHIELLVISRIDNRMAALIGRRTGAAVLDLTSMLKLGREQGPPYNILSVFGRDFPSVLEGTVVASRQFLDAHPESARDIIREQLRAIRALQDRTVLTAEIIKHLAAEPAEADALARLYLDNKVWDANGGLTTENIEATIKFAEDAKLIDPGMTPAQATDRSFLDSVLAEMGTK